ncbi:putative serine hydroxymethyltransferase OS=Streptomyces microflavus OX=1919 GN=glyA PE=3 SV=1 [Streptomyces microflavus]
MRSCAALLHRVLEATTVKNEREYVLDAGERDAVRAGVAELCARYPLPLGALPTAPAASGARAGGAA